MDMQREYRGDVLYVYDRVYPKKIKERQISRTYRTQTTQQGGRPSERKYGKAFAESQRARATAQEHRSNRTVGQAATHGYGASNRPRRSNSESYTYRPGNARGGEAVRERPLKLMLDRIVNFFETIEERGRRDEAIAKQKAIAWKKFSEYRHIFFTSLLLLAITVAFVALVYKMFFVVENVTVSGTERYTDGEIIASAGFSLGDNLYSFAASDAEDTITFLCPYIRSAVVNRSIPKSVAITLEDDSAVYYADIWGDRVMLSAGLRILDVTESEEVAEEGLIELILPPVKYSVAGRGIEFYDVRNERFIRDVLTEVLASSLAGADMVDAVDLSDAYDIKIESCGRYLLRLGDETDCDLKLRMAYKTMTSNDFDQLLPARIDLSEVGKAIIKPDASLRFDG